MNLNDVHRGIKKNKARKRLGRGIGSGQGKTAGRGHKGQKSRAGTSYNPVFQGGTASTVIRIPKRGFFNKWAVRIAAVNVAALATK
jgi:large subunit ribosomal protein L15